MNGIDFCTNNGVLRILHTVLKALDLVCIILPIVLIVLIIIDVCKNVINNDASEQKKNLVIAIKRIIYCSLVFFAPLIVNVITNMLGDLGVNYALCIENARNYVEVADTNSNFSTSPPYGNQNSNSNSSNTNSNSNSSSSKKKPSTSTSSTKKKTEVTKIVLNKTRATIGDMSNVVSRGKTYANNLVKLKVASIYPANAKNKKVKWSVVEGSDNVKVNQKGQVRGRNGGSAVVRVTSVDNPNVYADCKINIVHSVFENVKIRSKTTVTGKYDKKKYVLKKNTKVELLGSLKGRRRNYSDLTFKIRLKNGAIANIKGKYLTFHSYHIYDGYKNSDYEDYINNNGFTSKTNYLIWVNQGTQRFLLFKKKNKKWSLVENFKTSTGDEEGKNTGDKGGSTTIKFNLQVRKFDSEPDSLNGKMIEVEREENGVYFGNTIHIGSLPKNISGGNPSENEPSSHGCPHLSASFRNKLYTKYNGGSSNRFVGSKVIYY